MTTTTFKQLDFSDSILQVCKEEKFIHPTVNQRILKICSKNDGSKAI